ncbi:MAG TPA: type II toxin-antitoxin system VapC family toxin [Candidatus Cybelea sp.]
MIGLDTNVLVRYLTQDEPVQSARATAIIERRLTHADPGFVSVLAMVETVWVLERSYGLTRKQIAHAVELILQIDALVVENEEQVFAAMTALKDSLGSFADALVAALGANAGCSNTLTVDRSALRIPGFAPA